MLETTRIGELQTLGERLFGLHPDRLVQDWQSLFMKGVTRSIEPGQARELAFPRQKFAHNGQNLDGKPRITLFVTRLGQ